MFRRIPRFVSHKNHKNHPPRSTSTSYQPSQIQQQQQQCRRRLGHSISQRHFLSTTTTTTNDTSNHRQRMMTTTTTTWQNTTTLYPYHHHQHHQQHQQQRRWHSTSSSKSSTLVTMYDDDEQPQQPQQPQPLDLHLVDEEKKKNNNDHDYSIQEEDYDSHTNTSTTTTTTTTTTPSSSSNTFKEFQTRRKDQARQLSQLFVHHTNAHDFKYWRMKLKSASRRNFESTLDNMEVLSPLTSQTTLRDMLQERLDYVFVPLLSEEDAKKSNSKSSSTTTTPTGKTPPVWVQELLLLFLEDKLPLDFSKQSYYQTKLQDCVLESQPRQPQPRQQDTPSASVAAAEDNNNNNNNDNDDHGVVVQSPSSSPFHISHTHHQGYGPIVNRMQFEQTVQTLMTFQNCIATQYPMFVNFKERTKVKNMYQKARTAAQQQVTTDTDTDTDNNTHNVDTDDETTINTNHNTNDDDDDETIDTTSTPPRRRRPRRPSSKLTTSQFLTLRTNDIAALHALKSISQQRQEATELAHMLAERLAPDAHTRLLLYMQDFVMAMESKDDPPPVIRGKNSKQQLLVGILEHLMGDSTVVLMNELAKFLYALHNDDTDTETVHDDTNDDDDDTTTAIAAEGERSTSNMTEMDLTTTTTIGCVGGNDNNNNNNNPDDHHYHHYYPSVLTEMEDIPWHFHDSRLKRMWKQRKTSENQFVDSLLRMANTKVFNILELRKELADSGGGSSSHPNGQDAADKEEAYEKMLQQLQNATLTKKERRQKKTKQQKYKFHQQNRFHVVYDAMELQWDETNMANNLRPTKNSTTITTPTDDLHNLQSESSVVEELPPPPPAERPTNRTIFLDNLPIDVEEMELIDLYSRCGPITSVQILNKREEYDPGPLSAKQKRALIKRKKHTYLGRQGKYVRPRSPVYAILTFADDEGCQRAIHPTLSVFGKVIRRHAVLSTVCTKMTTLYVEDIPSGHYAIDIERKLSHLLHPNFYVCLDKSYGSGGNGKDHYDPQKDQPGSCAIKFPNFEMAHQAYWKLQELHQEYQREQQQQQQQQPNKDDTPPSPTTTDRAWSIQWMKTPFDAMEYWKRESVIDRR